MSTTRSARSGSSGARLPEAGTGLIASIAGVAAFLGFLLFAVQVTYDLYATSAVTSAAFDAVRLVAGTDGQTEIARASAEEHARSVLGPYGRRVEFEWSQSADRVSLHVRASNPGFLPESLRRPLRIDTVDRTVTARIERLR
jgi:hypothetical protein